MVQRPGFVEFELDLMEAVIDQLPRKMESVDAAPLTRANTRQIPNAQGVYQLLHNDVVKYIGKTDAEKGLRSRLERHYSKLEHRHGIVPGNVKYRAVQIYVLTAMDIETRLIDYYDTKEYWNGSGFGSNDPGRRRETTNQAPEGFDSQFPIDIDVPGAFVPEGTYSTAELLWRLKDELPYTFRYETVGRGSQAYKQKPHPDYTISSVTVSAGPHSARELIRLALSALPKGWQATEFPGYVILYKETENYIYGKSI